MATASQPDTTLLTVEEFALRPDPGHPEELVRGEILTMPPPGARHGSVCFKIAMLIGNHVMAQHLGHVLTNDAGVITSRGPDSVRGPDVAYYSYVRLPRGPLPVGYPAVPPELVVEVLSPNDRWPPMLAKVAEYLNAGVAVVLVLDPERRSAHLHEGSQPTRILGEGDELDLDRVLTGLRIPMSRVFS